MSKRCNKLLTLLLSALLTMVFTITAAAVDHTAVTGTIADDYTGKTVVLSTNDVHGAVDGYQYIAGLKDELETRGADVIMVDAGDFSQGTIYVSTSKGAEAVSLMRLAGYNFAALGNHEFDFGPVAMNSNIDAAQAEASEGQTSFTVLCSNLLDNETNEPKYTENAVYNVETMGDLKVGFIGVTTPQTQTKASPANFTSVHFNAGNADELQVLYDSLDDQYAAVKKAGADVVILLTHLGVDAESEPFRSDDAYAAMTEKPDMIIDGHSHTVMTEGEKGEPIMSTGTKFMNIGVTVIDESAEKIEDHFLYHLRDSADADYPEDAYSDSTVKAYAENLMSTMDAEYGRKIAETKVRLNGEKAVDKDGVYGNRDGETNLGDLITDSIMWYVKRDGTDLGVPDENVVAITNGGGIRATLNIGDISRKDIKTVIPFGNTVAAVTVTGRELLEALEASTYAAPEVCGGFPQIAGMNIEIDKSAAYDANDESYPGSSYFGPKTINRVTIKDINGKAFDADAKYVVLTNDFCAAGGDTYYAFSAATDRFDTSIPLDDALTEYIVDNLKCVVGEDYKDPQGRIAYNTNADDAYEEALAALENAADIDAYLTAVDKLSEKAAKLADESKKADAQKKVNIASDIRAAYAAAQAANDRAAIAEAKAAAAEAVAAMRVKTVTVDETTVNKAAIDKAVADAGGSNDYVTKIVLGKKVKKISASAFSSCPKLTTIEVKTRKLTKKSVKKSLKGSKVKTVKVNVGGAKDDKKYVKKYAGFFTRKNAGKKVTVKK